MSASPAPEPRLGARMRRGVGAALILLLGALAVGVFVTALTPHGSTAVLAPSPTDDGVAVSEATPEVIYVHVLGQVTEPGLYELHDGDRAIDAVAAAGGFTDAADAAALNLARPVSDGEQIRVPAVGEAAVSSPGTVADGRVDLNSADAATLETLPRIGPAMAARIVAWREENGRFAAVDDLLDIAGIGDATLEALRDLVIV